MNTFFNLIRDRYQLVAGLTLLAVIAIGSAIPTIKFTSDFKAFFSPENPQMMTFEVLENDFNKQDSLAFLVVPNKGDIFTEETMGLIRTLTEQSWQVPHSRRVDSVTNYLRTTSANDELTSDELVPTDVKITEELLASVKGFVLGDSIAIQFTNPRGNVGLISVALTLPEGNETANKEVITHAREMLKGLDYNRSDITVHINGTSMVNQAMEEAVEADIAALIPSSNLLIFIAMFFLIRVFSGTMLTIGVITLTNITVFGAIAWVGIVLTPSIGAVPSMITVIAVADCMHFLVSYYHELGEGKSKSDAIDTALQINFSPMFVTSVTTAIGFLCLNFSESPPYQDLGNIMAFAAIVAFVFTVTFVPAVLHWAPAPKKEKVANRHLGYFSAMESLADWVIKHHKALMVGVITFSIFAIGALFQNDISNSWTDNYDETFEFKQSLEIQENDMYGAHYIDYRIDSGKPQGINDPRYMQDLNRFTQWLTEQPNVGYVSSFSNQVKTINRVLHDDNDAYYGIPDNRELLSQSNLLFEMSLPFGMGIEEQVDINKQSIRLRANLHELTSSEMLAFDQKVKEWAANNTQNISVSEGSGLDMIFAHIMQRNTMSLVQGTSIALVLISLLMIWVLKSVKLGLLSLVPNIFPATLAYGVWALLDGTVDLAVSVVGTMSIGLVVDDTVHFLSKYQLARNEKRLDVYEAIRYAFRTVGVAMMVTSVVLTLGFGLLIFSHLRPTWAMGELLSITIMFAIFVDFLLLPGLLILFDNDDRHLVEN